MLFIRKYYSKILWNLIRLSSMLNKNVNGIENCLTCERVRNQNNNKPTKPLPCIPHWDCYVITFRSAAGIKSLPFLFEMTDTCFNTTIPNDFIYAYGWPWSIFEILFHITMYDKTLNIVKSDIPSVLSWWIKKLDTLSHVPRVIKFLKNWFLKSTLIRWASIH